ELEATAVEWSERIAAGPTYAFGLTKWLVNQSLDVDRATMIHNEAAAVEMNNASEDCQEGIASFRERRDPVWKGY
ncbi:MAG: enoyl-CoA hydratase-related protein, partial [Acidimicrobiales bacterium]